MWGLTRRAGAALLLVATASAVWVYQTREIEVASVRSLAARHVLASTPRPRMRAVRFERNVGQTDARVAFIARGGEHTTFLTEDGLVIPLPLRGPEQALQMKLRGARSDVVAEGIRVLPGRVNYLLGNDRTRWHTQVPAFEAVRYPGVYPGIDILFYDRAGDIEYDFVVAPGADPDIIKFGFAGGTVHLDPLGNLIVSAGSSGAALTLLRPHSYQLVQNARREVKSRYEIDGAGEVRILLGEYDPALTLTIDPVLTYSSYFGGSGQDQGMGIAVDAAGSIYVTGLAASLDFPTERPLSGTLRGSTDAFVAKFDSTGQTLLFATYFGGTGSDGGRGVALFPSGEVAIVGETASTDLPVRAAVQSTYGGGALDGFAAKLSADGSALVYSTYLGGSATDVIRIIAVDRDGAAYVAGRSGSSDFPVANAVQSIHGGGPYDAFVSKLGPAGSPLAYSTFMGGTGDDGAYGIAVEATGAAYVTGYGNSPNFPVKSAYQATTAGAYEALVWKLNADGGLAYSTYLGGTANDWALGIASDAAGNAYLTGFTSSANFPTSGAFQSARAGTGDVFVTKLDATGTSLRYSTYLGGSGSEQGYAIAVDTNGYAYVTGRTASTDFPRRDAFQPNYGGGAFDAFVTRLGPSGRDLDWSTYLGGSGIDSSGDFGGANFGGGIVVTGSGQVYVTGFTTSTNFPTYEAWQRTFRGVSDAFIARMITARPFTESFLVAGVTPVRAIHIVELRDRIDALRTRNNLPPFAWTDSSLLGVSIKAVHVTELRAAIDAVYRAVNRTAPAYTDGTLTPQSSVIRRAHIEELRRAVIELE